MNKPIKLLGVDWGEKRIGLAIADSETKLATPLGVVFSLKEVRKAIEKESVERVIIGEPKSLSGGNRLSDKFEQFLSKFKKIPGIKIELMDERLTSKEADNLFGGKKDKAPRDALAAMLILQSYLDKK